MSKPKRVHYIRVELPADASPTDIDRVQQAVIAVLEQYEEEFMYDIPVSGGAWYPPDDEEPTEPIPVALSKLHHIIYARPSTNSPADAMLLHAALQDLEKLGMSQIDLRIHLERERAINDVALRNEYVEDNLLTALDMVMGNVDSKRLHVRFQEGTT